MRYVVGRGALCFRQSFFWICVSSQQGACRGASTPQPRPVMNCLRLQFATFSVKRRFSRACPVTSILCVSALREPPAGAPQTRVRCLLRGCAKRRAAALFYFGGHFPGFAFRPSRAPAAGRAPRSRDVLCIVYDSSLPLFLFNSACRLPVLSEVPWV